MSFRQGFSTLSQQLARNLYKEVGFKDSITRKLKEMITAIQIERTYTKDEILEMYLNTFILATEPMEQNQQLNDFLIKMHLI